MSATNAVLAEKFRRFQARQVAETLNELGDLFPGVSGEARALEDRDVVSLINYALIAAGVAPVTIERYDRKTGYPIFRGQA